VEFLEKARDEADKLLEKLENGDTKKAVKELTKVIKELVKANMEGADVADLVDALVGLARDLGEFEKPPKAAQDVGQLRELAEAALGDAQEFAGLNPKVDKEIAKAVDELVKAQEALTSGNLDEAANHYGKSLKAAQKAIKKAG
jgi:hypothetical protein